MKTPLEYCPLCDTLLDNQGRHVGTGYLPTLIAICPTAIWQRESA